MLEIRQIDRDQVVTVIEVLSPKNKRLGEGRNQYNAERRKVLESLSHLVKIDLLRAGETRPMSGGVQSGYNILVSRSIGCVNAGSPPLNLFRKYKLVSRGLYPRKAKFCKQILDNSAVGNDRIFENHSNAVPNVESF